MTAGKTFLLLFLLLVSPSHAIAKGKIKTYKDLLVAKRDDFSYDEIGRYNLICATGLPGSEKLNVEMTLRIYRMWADEIKLRTERGWTRFKENPDFYENSEAFYKMLVLVTYLERDLGSQYTPKFRDSIVQKQDNFEIFRDSRELFIHGCLEKRGTCSSLIVRTVTVARMLGYPIRMANTYAHPFMRWYFKDGTYKNFDTTGNGLKSWSDNKYIKEGKIPIEYIHKGLLLKTMEPFEEVELSLDNRAVCLTLDGRIDEAIIAYATAKRLSLRHDQYYLTNIYKLYSIEINRYTKNKRKFPAIAKFIKEDYWK